MVGTTLAAVVIVMITFCGPIAAEAISLSFVPPSQSAQVGQPVSVDVVINDVAPPSIGAFDVDVAFNASLLSLTSVNFGSFLGDPSLFEALTSSSAAGGVADIAEVSLLTVAELDALQTQSSFVLFSLTFDVLAPGTSALVLSIQELSDADANLLEATASTGTISAVPEPASLLLVGIGLGALGFAGRAGRRGPHAKDGLTRD